MRVVHEGWHITPTGTATTIWTVTNTRWREPCIIAAEHRTENATPRGVADAVRIIRQRLGRNPEASVMLTQGAETLGLVDGYAQAGMPISPAPRQYTEAMGVTRAASLLRRTMPAEYGEQHAGSTRLRVHRSCRHTLAGLEAVRWADSRPVIEGEGADYVRALAAVMAVLPPEPPDPVDVVAEIAARYYPPLDRTEERHVMGEDEWLDRWSRP